jgi:glutamate-1-semialdehyde 2,1-aminomutase
MPNGVRFNEDYPAIKNSQALYERAERLIPCGTQMLAKGTQQHIKGVAPIYIDRGKGARVWDVDGNEFLDLTMGMGPASLGYGYARIDDAIRDQLGRGINFTLLNKVELDVAELFVELVPGAERVRFSKSGADATSAAVRLARAHTGREKVICCGYHGWHDWYIGKTNRNRGIPRAVQQLTAKIPYNDLAALENALADDVACVIMEAVVFEPPKDGYLETVKELAHKAGALLVFDEIWTGFRIALGGAQEYFGVTPDLSTFSKACANGMPISVLAGRAEIMSTLEDDDVFFFTTFGGETLSLTATRETILEMKEKDVPAVISQKCARLRDGYNTTAAKLEMPYTKSIGLDYRTMVSFAPSDPSDTSTPLAMKSLLQQELIKRGVLWTGFHHVSFSHTDADIDYALDAYADALPVLKAAMDAGDVNSALRGEPVHPVFRNLGIGQH